MSVWNAENVVDVAESIGIAQLNRDVADHLSRDVEYRMSQVLEEALKFMRHAKRTTLTTQDISQALRLLDVEPLYGYESTRALRFGEASIGPGQPLFYVEDEEVDFEKLINAPLPKVPREMSITAHWLAVEGVQPSIPQNPTQVDQRSQELAAKGPGANPTLAAVSGNDNVSVKPLVKHVLSKELQLYFERICSAILDEANDEYRTAAFASLRTDPGLHQLIPYFVQFVADKITHNLKSLFILSQSMQLLSALLENPSLYLAPYIPSLVPSVLTCLLAKQLGPSSATDTTHFALRDFSASLLSSIARTYGPSSATLKPRIARACLKHFLDTHKPFASHYGAVLGLTFIAGPGGVRALLVPNLKAYDAHLHAGLTDDAKKLAAEHVLQALLRALHLLEHDALPAHAPGRERNGHPEGDALRERLVDLLGDVVGTKVLESGNSALVAAVLEGDVMV
nr:transcription initiation factor tfiid subunit 6 [Quercus suber]